MVTTVYVANTPNCKRIRDVLRGLHDAEFVDVTRSAPPAGLTHVPTVVLDDGQVLVGQRAFDWLASLGSKADAAVCVTSWAAIT